MPSREAIRPKVLTWVLVLGGLGLVVGYVAPLLLAPEANTGPLIGLLITGPAAALAGLALGVASRFAPVGNVVRGRWLSAAALLVCAATLYRSLPEPAVHGYVIDAHAEGCAPPAARLAQAVATWEQEVARVTWAKPAAAWRENAARNVETDPGAVVAMRVYRKAPILRRRTPWSRNTLDAGDWTDVDELTEYYANDAGADCASYLARERTSYWPAVHADSASPKPANPWPPADTLGFLRLQTLGAVPREYSRLLR